MSRNWALYSGLAHKSDWSQRREDRKQDQLYAEKNLAIEEANLQRSLESEKAMQEYISQFQNLEVSDQDKKRLDEQWKKEKQNLLKQISSYNGDISKWYLTGGMNDLNKFKDNFMNSDSYTNAMRTKESMNVITDGISKGMYIPPVTVKVKEKDENGREVIVTKKMNANEALRQHQEGTVLMIDSTDSVPEKRINLDVKQLLTQGKKGEPVKADDVYRYMMSQGSSENQALHMRNMYAEMVNEQLKAGNKNPGWTYNPSALDEHNLKIDQFNIKSGQFDETQRMRAEQLATSFSKRSDQQSASSRQSTGVSSGGRAVYGNQGVYGKTESVYQDAYVSTTRMNEKNLVPGFNGVGATPIPPKIMRHALEAVGFTQYNKDYASNIATLEDANKDGIFFIPDGQNFLLIKDPNSNRISDQVSTNAPSMDKDGDPMYIKDIGGQITMLDDEGVPRSYFKVYMGSRIANHMEGSVGDWDDLSSKTKDTHIAYIPAEVMMGPNAQKYVEEEMKWKAGSNSGHAPNNIYENVQKMYDDLDQVYMDYLNTYGNHEDAMSNLRAYAAKNYQGTDRAKVHEILDKIGSERG